MSPAHGPRYLALNSAFLRAFVSPGESLEAALWTLQGLTWRSPWNLGTILEQMWIHTLALRPNWPPGPSWMRAGVWSLDWSENSGRQRSLIFHSQTDQQGPQGSHSTDMSSLAMTRYLKCHQIPFCHLVPGKTFLTLDGVYWYELWTESAVVCGCLSHSRRCWLLLLSWAPYHLSPFKDSLDWGEMGKDTDRKFFVLNLKSWRLQLELTSTFCFLRRWENSLSRPLWVVHALWGHLPTSPLSSHVIPIVLTLGLSFFSLEK